MNKLKILENDYLDNEQTENILNHIRRIIIYKRGLDTQFDISEIEEIFEESELLNRISKIDKEDEGLELINLKIRKKKRNQNTTSKLFHYL